MANNYVSVGLTNYQDQEKSRRRVEPATDEGGFSTKVTEDDDDVSDEPSEEETEALEEFPLDHPFHARNRRFEKIIFVFYIFHLVYAGVLFILAWGQREGSWIVDILSWFALILTAVIFSTILSVFYAAVLKFRYKHDRMEYVNPMIAVLRFAFVWYYNTLYIWLTVQVIRLYTASVKSSVVKNILNNQFSIFDLYSNERLLLNNFLNNIEIAFMVLTLYFSIEVAYYYLNRHSIYDTIPIDQKKSQ